MRSTKTGMREQRRALVGSVAGTLLPIGLAVLPLGLVFQNVVPAATSDVLFVLLVLFSAGTVAAVVRLSPAPVILACLGGAAAAATGRPNIFAISLIPLLAFTLQHVDIEVLPRRFVRGGLVVIILVVGLYYSTGFNSQFDRTVWRDYSGEFVFRQAVGFDHPNRAMMTWCAIAVAAMVFAGPRARLIRSGPLFVGTLFMFAATDSRTSAALTLGVVFFATIWRRRIDSAVPPSVRVGAILAPWLATAGAFGLATLATNQWVSTVLTGRPAIYASLLETYPILTLFGTESVEGLSVDNGYLQMILGKGPILTVVYLSTLSIILALPKRLSLRTLLVLGALLASALVETTLLNFAFLFVLLASTEIDRRLWPSTLSTPVAGLAVSTPKSQQMTN